MAREAALGPISVFPNIRVLCIQRAVEDYGGSLSKYLRALIYADLFTHNKLVHFEGAPCVSCKKITKHAPLAYDGIDLHTCIECGATIPQEDPNEAT